MYLLNGIKWGSSTLGTPSGEITWDDDLSGLTPASGSSVSDLVTSLRSAFVAWENVAALDFREVGSGADVNVGFGSFSTDAIPQNDGAVATASWFGGSGFSEPTGVEIQFNTDEVWTPFADSEPNTVNFFVVALHEIGHVIGLGHVPDPTQIMNAVISAPDLGDGDKGGAQVLYGLDGGDVPVDPGTGGTIDDGGDGGGGGAGFLVGLLALIFGVFTGGLGVAALAAGRVARGDEDDHELHDHDHQIGEMQFHPLYLPQIPAEDFAQITNAEGEGDDEDDFFLL